MEYYKMRRIEQRWIHYNLNRDKIKIENFKIISLTLNQLTSYDNRKLGQMSTKTKMEKP